MLLCEKDRGREPIGNLHPNEAPTSSHRFHDTPFPYSVGVDAPLADAHRLMRQHGFRHLPVALGVEIAGILTDRDIKLILGPDFGSPDERDLRVRDAFVEQARGAGARADPSGLI